MFTSLEPALRSAAHPFNQISGGPTKANIENLLLTYMPENTGPDDRVVVFFAGHGERRRLPGRVVEAGYLVPSDARPDAWHTYLDLDQILRAGNLCPAKHYFYLIDSCYSGLATARGRAQPTHTSKTCSLAGRDKSSRPVRHGRPFPTGSGYDSYFTEYVLRGLRGDADLMKDGVVTATELMVYVKNEVVRQFGSTQTPDFGPLPGHESGGDFVFKLPGFTAEDHFTLGTKMIEAGRRLGDAHCFASAARNLESAVRIKRGKAWPEAERLRGIALAAQGAYLEQAILELADADAHMDNEAALPLRDGIRSEARISDTRRDFFRNSSRTTPIIPMRNGLVRYLAWPRSTGGGRRLALVIGRCKVRAFSSGSSSPSALTFLTAIFPWFRFRRRPSRYSWDEFRSLAQRCIELDTVLVYIGTTGGQRPNQHPEYRTPTDSSSFFAPCRFCARTLSM